MRRRLVTPVLSVICLAFAATLNAHAPEVLTLADAVRDAIAHSGATSDARDGISLADAGERMSRWRIAPQVTFDALGSFGQSNLANQSYGARFSETFLTGTQVRANLGAMTSLNQLGTYYTSNSSLQITQPLLRGFGGEAVRRDLELARMRSEDARRDEVRVQQQVALSMAGAYYRIAAQTKLVDVADQALVRAKVLQASSEAKLALGRVSKLDVLRAQQLVVQADLQALDARTAVENAKDAVRLLLLRDASFDFVVDPEIPSPASTLTLDAALETAASHRLELEGASSSVRQATMQLAAAADEGKPQVDVTLQMSRYAVANSLGAAFGAGPYQFATFAGVSVPLDRTPAATSKQTATIALDKAKRQLEDTKLRIAQEVRIAWREQARLARTLEQAEAAVGFADQEVELATLRNQRGLSNNLDVVTAEGSLMSARALRFSALADAAIADLRLRVAMGVLDPMKDFR